MEMCGYKDINTGPVVMVFLQKSLIPETEYIVLSLIYFGNYNAK